AGVLCPGLPQSPPVGYAAGPGPAPVTHRAARRQEAQAGWVPPPPRNPLPRTPPCPRPLPPAPPEGGAGTASSASRSEQRKQSGRADGERAAFVTKMPARFIQQNSPPIKPPPPPPPPRGPRADAPPFGFFVRDDAPGGGCGPAVEEAAAQAVAAFGATGSAAA